MFGGSLVAWRNVLPHRPCASGPGGVAASSTQPPPPAPPIPPDPASLTGVSSMRTGACDGELQPSAPRVAIQRGHASGTPFRLAQVENVGAAASSQPKTSLVRARTAICTASSEEYRTRNPA